MSEKREANRSEGTPADGIGSDDGVDRKDERTGHGEGARDVHAATPDGAGPQEERGVEQHEQTERDVDEEGPSPAEPLGDDAAEEDARRPACRR